MMSADDSKPQDCLTALAIHRGAIDQSTVTTKPPAEAMDIIMKALQSMGVSVEIEGAYKRRCIRPSRHLGGLGAPEPVGDTHVSDAAESGGAKACTEALNSAGDTDEPRLVNPVTFTPTQSTLYGENPTQDPGGEVVFTVELTRINGLKDTLSIDIRRLRGSLRSYGFVYDTLRALVAS